MLGRAVTHADLDRQVHLDGPRVAVQREQHELRVDDLHVRGLGDVRSGHRPRPALHQLEGDRVVREGAQPQLLGVEHDLGDVFLDVLDGAELVEHAGHLDRGDGGSFEGVEQDAAQGVPQGHAVAGAQWVHLEAREVATRLHLVDARRLERSQVVGLGAQGGGLVGGVRRQVSSVHVRRIHQRE